MLKHNMHNVECLLRCFFEANVGVNFSTHLQILLMNRNQYDGKARVTDAAMSQRW